MALAPAAVVGLFKALDAHRDEEVPHPEHLLAEIIVDEGPVGEGVEGHIPVLFAQADDVLFPHEGLAAGEETGVGTQLLGLGQHTVHFLKGQALLVAVFRRPAAGAVHIAGGGGIHQDEPGDVDVVFGRRLLGHMIAPDAALIDGIGEKRLEDIGIVVPNQPLGIMGPFAVGLVGQQVQGLEGPLAPHISVELLDHVHQIVCDLACVLVLPLFDQVVQNGLKGLALGRVGELLRYFHTVCFLSVILLTGKLFVNPAPGARSLILTE